MQKPEAGIARARSATSGTGPLTHHASRITFHLPTPAPPAAYTTLLGPLAYRLPIAAVSLPLGSASTGPPRRPEFVSKVANPAPKPPPRPLPRTLARRLAPPQHGIAARRGCLMVAKRRLAPKAG